MKCGSTNDVQVHHIKPKINGGDDSESNLILLCYDCHKAAHGGSFAKPNGELVEYKPNNYSYTMIVVNMCHRCGHEWAQRGEQTPERCPNCNSPYWSVPRGQPKGPRKAKREAKKGKE